MHRKSGFFVPPETGIYTFDILSDDISQLFFSLSGDPAAKVLIAEAPSHTSYRWDRYKSQRSKPIHLESGKAHYIEVLHNQGGGPYYLYLGAKYYNTTLTRSEVPAEHEVQRLIIESPVISPKQVMYIYVCTYVYSPEDFKNLINIIYVSIHTYVCFYP